MSDEANKKKLKIQSKEDQIQRRKLITVVGQIPHIDETEARRENQKTKKDPKQKESMTQSRPKYSQNWNSAK